MTAVEKKVLIISENHKAVEEIGGLLAAGGDAFSIRVADSPLRVFDMIYGDPPDLVIIDQTSDTKAWQEQCRQIRSDTVFGHLPILLILDPSRVDQAGFYWHDTPVDDFLERPVAGHELLSRVSMAFARAARARDANPLTRLPGNFSIMKEMQERIEGDSPFAVAYVDLDHFKSYNDKYGFLRGDEVLRMTARLLTNAVRRVDSPQAFVGHIGGDDFVFMVPPGFLDRVCREVIGNFDLVVANFYDEGDRERGYIESRNRRGQDERFPFVSLSIAVVTNEYRPIHHIGQLSEIAAGLKKRAKAIEGSTYLKDMRGSLSPLGSGGAHA